MWYAVHRDGTLLSITTLEPRELPTELMFTELGEEKPDWSTLEWDPQTLRMVDKPPPPEPVDRVDDLLAKVPALSKLDAVELEGFKAEVGKLLGDDRYRDPGEIAAVEVGP